MNIKAIELNSEIRMESISNLFWNATYIYDYDQREVANICGDMIDEDQLKRLKQACKESENVFF
jgi:hypothetical protein